MENNQLVDNRQIQVDEAEAMGRLLQNDDFKLLFQDKYVDAFAITNIYNIHGYDDATRRRFLEKSMARGTFVKFIDDILEDGRNAIASIHEEQAGNDSEEHV